ncbi:hypothetical protein ACJIZ3_010666 [Penstemon smallii]|uniref:Uncharacterized protein n=1 Tax=Penstemon smallii TaxID=265156 RepID=A0ABD3UH02_9LAMI
MANVTSSVAGYTGEKAVAAGQTVAGYAADTLAATKDAVVASEEKAAEFAARKREEAKRELEAKKQSQEKGGGGQETFTTKEEGETRPSADITKEQMQMQKPSEKIQESFQGGTEYEQQGQESGGGVFQAIGETIVEIGQTTKDLLVGQSPVEEGMDQKHESRGTIDEKFRGTGCEGI